MSDISPGRTTSAANWATQPERSNAWVLSLMRWIAVGLGRRISRGVLHAIALYFLVFGGEAARASADYLRRVYQRPPRWRERYRHIHHFAATVLDRVYLLRGDFHLFDVEVTGVEHLEGVLADGRGALLIGAHFGSFEALRALGQSRGGLRVAMVMYEDNARLINQTLKSIAPGADLRIIGLGRMEAMLELRDWLDAGGVAGLLADRSLQGAAGMSRRSQTRWIDFLGQPAPFSDGPFRLAALLRRPVVFMTGVYHGGSRYELCFAPLADFAAPRQGGACAQDEAVSRALHAYVTLLERHCRQSPANWFNFFDLWASDTPPTPLEPCHAHPTSQPISLRPVSDAAGDRPGPASPRRQP